MNDFAYLFRDESNHCIFMDMVNPNAYYDNKNTSQ